MTKAGIVTTLMIGRRGFIGTVVALMTLTAIGCEELPNEPDVGSGKVLEATVDGVDVTFELDEAENEYDAATLFGRFSGSTSDAVMTLSITFAQFNIDEGPFPTVISGPDITMTLVRTTATGTKTYVRPLNANALQCSITITGSDGDIVDGHFFGTLESTDNPSDVVVVMDGAFSAKLIRK